MATRPVVLPELYSGEGNWSDWIDHFESVAAVNQWDDQAKILWIRVRLTGRAQTAYKRLPADVRESFELTKKGLQERFEPKSKKELYIVNFQTRQKQKSESWADYAEDLRLLADKAFPELSEDARERLALSSYLAQLDNPQVAVGVRQQRPKSIVDAVRATLEMESYLVPAEVKRVAQVASEDPVVAAVQGKQDIMMDLLQNLVQRIDKLEVSERNRLESRGPRRSWPRRLDTRQRPSGEDTRRRRESMVCWECGKQGHPARECPGRQQNQGNYRPSAP